MTKPPFRNHPSHLMPPKNCCRYHDLTETPTEYYEWFNWAEEKYLNGEEQESCKKCGNWFYPEEMNKAKDTPPKLFLDILRLLEDILENEVGLEGSLRISIYKTRFRNLRKRTRLLLWR